MINTDINRSALRSGFRDDEIFLKIIGDMENPLLVGVESYLSQILSLRSTDKEVTIWANDDITCEFLNSYFEGCENIKIKSVDIYDETKREETKFKNIFFFPEFRSKRQFKRGQYYGNNAATVAVQLLMKNLSEDGVLTAVMPSRVNSSMLEVHFRNVFGKHIMKVVRLPENTLKHIAPKAYLYKFSAEPRDTIFISDSLDDEGKEFYSTFVRSSRQELDLAWKFDYEMGNGDEQKR